MSALVILKKYAHAFALTFHNLLTFKDHVGNIIILIEIFHLQKCLTIIISSPFDKISTSQTNA